MYRVNYSNFLTLTKYNTSTFEEIKELDIKSGENTSDEDLIKFMTYLDYLLKGFEILRVLGHFVNKKFDLETIKSDVLLHLKANDILNEKISQSEIKDMVNAQFNDYIELKLLEEV